MKYGVLFILFAFIVLLFVGAFIELFAFLFDSATGWALGKNAKKEQTNSSKKKLRKIINRQ
jgi:type III secretory pathway component EscT